MKLFLIAVFLVGTNSQIAIFSRSGIIQDTCDRTNHLETVVVTSELECARICSGDIHCRRWLHCDSTKVCKTYKDGKDCIQTKVDTSCVCYRKKKGCHRDYKECTCPLGYYGENCENIIDDCMDGYTKGMTEKDEVIVSIKPKGAEEPFEVLCYLQFGGYTYILDRDSTCLSVNFNRSIEEYQKGFGPVPFNRFLGFDKILQIMAKTTPDKVFILNTQYFLTDWSYCQDTFYDFNIGSAETHYPMHVSGIDVTGMNRCNSTLPPTGTPFITYDSNDTQLRGCASRFGGGWWFDDPVYCTRQFLTGTMDGSGVDNFFLGDLKGQILKRSFWRIKSVPRV